MLLAGSQRPPPADLLAGGGEEVASLRVLEQLLEKRELSASRSVLKVILDEAVNARPPEERGSEPTMGDLEAWCRGMRRAKPDEILRCIGRRALLETGFWGSIAFAVGYVLNFGNTVGLWPASPKFLDAASRLWLVGSLVFLKVQADDAQATFEARESSLELLRSTIRTRDSTASEPILSSLDANRDGVVSLLELRAFFEGHNIILSDEALAELISDATWRGSSTAVPVPTFRSYLLERPARTLRDMRGYVASKLFRSFAFLCMNAYVLGSALFIVDAATFGGAGVIAFALGYIGHIQICVQNVEAQFEQIATAKAALRAWAAGVAGASQAQLGESALPLAERLDADGNGIIEASELRGALELDSAPVSDAALQHVIGEMQSDDNDRVTTYAEFGEYVSQLRPHTESERREYVWGRSVVSAPIWALMLGLCSCLLSLGQMYLWMPLAAIAKLCASLSLASGLVPLYVYFGLKRRRYREEEDVKMGLSGLFLSARKGA